MNANVTRPSDFPETADIETSSDGYAARFSGPLGDWMLRLQTEQVLAWLAATQATSVLDVGGGHGQLALPLARAGFSVSVLGSAPECARRLQAAPGAPAPAFQTGNVLALPFPDRAFDAVVSVRLLPHCERWLELVRELCRVARRAVVVDYPVCSIGSRLLQPLFGLKKRIEGNTRTWRSFTHAELAEAFSGAGFSRTARCGQFSAPLVIHRLLRQPALSQVIEALPRRLGWTQTHGSPVLAWFTRIGGDAAQDG
jgi:2-polyprenyl-3-methyl-5-hydroxy-6-metoxy-1,4-benzoquinol methylase